jgi:hypothetical protein
MVAAVTNISLYLRRYTSLKDMMLIIPGLEKRGRVDLSQCLSDDESESHIPRSSSYASSRGKPTLSQSPTIIL